jgi:hypothetical protein
MSELNYGQVMSIVADVMITTLESKQVIYEKVIKDCDDKAMDGNETWSEASAKQEKLKERYDTEILAIDWQLDRLERMKADALGEKYDNFMHPEWND